MSRRFKLAYWGLFIGGVLVGVLLGRIGGTVIGGDALSRWGLPLIEDMKQPRDTYERMENIRILIGNTIQFLIGNDPAGAFGAFVGLIAGVFIGGIMLLALIPVLSPNDADDTEEV